MNSSWKNKIGGNQLINEKFTLAPKWYVDAKNNGASKEQLFELVREYCLANTENPDDADDLFVELMIDTYEA